MDVAVKHPVGALLLGPSQAKAFGTSSSGGGKLLDGVLRGLGGESRPGPLPLSLSLSPLGQSIALYYISFHSLGRSVSGKEYLDDLRRV